MLWALKGNHREPFPFSGGGPNPNKDTLGVRVTKALRGSQKREPSNRRDAEMGLCFGLVPFVWRGSAGKPRRAPIILAALVLMTRFRWTGSNPSGGRREHLGAEFPSSEHSNERVFWAWQRKGGGKQARCGLNTDGIPRCINERGVGEVFSCLNLCALSPSGSPKNKSWGQVLLSLSK